MLILVYLVAWTPYAVVTLIGQFGPAERPLSASATAVPAYFAKTAVVLDPLVYGFSHPHFRSSLKHYLSNVLANQSLSLASVNGQHKSAPAGQAPVSSGAFQSRGMTVYPSAGPSMAASEHRCYVSGRGNGNKRRMLRTFRDLSRETDERRCASRARRQQADGLVAGVLHLTQSCAALVTLPLERPHGTSASSSSSNSSHRSRSPPGNGSPPAPLHQWRGLRGECPLPALVTTVSVN